MLDSLREELKNKVEELLGGAGIELIDFKLLVYGTKYTLRCLIDYPSAGITVGECAEMNKRIFAYLEETKLLGDDYTLEVNSPGLDRPLKTHKDFLRVQGKDICLWLDSPILGKEYLEGALADLSIEYLFLKFKDKIYRVEIKNIKFAKERLKI